jgi:hypothetical protein
MDVPMKKTYLLLCQAITLTCALPGFAQASLLAHESFTIQSSAGAQGAGASTSDMVYSSYSSDGWGWAGGAGAVQGSAALHGGTGAITAANETFKFNVGATVDALNASYGAGNWTIDNTTLSFASSTATQGNPRFGNGAGSFDIFWVGNNNWAQSSGTATNKQLNPVYASTQAELDSWAGSSALLNSAYFSNQGSGYLDLSYSLAADPLLVNSILSASASSNSFESLYLMGASSSLGMIIFTGGQGQPLPTLSFDVVATVPLPGAVWLFVGALLSMLGISDRRGSLWSLKSWFAV